MRTSLPRHKSSRTAIKAIAEVFHSLPKPTPKHAHNRPVRCTRVSTRGGSERVAGHMLCGANKDVFCPWYTHVIGFKVSEEDRTALTKLLCVVGDLLPYLAAGRQTGQGNWGGTRTRQQKGTVVAIVEVADVGRRDVGGTARHGTARICARNLAGNNKGQQPAGSTPWRERGTTVVLNLALRGNNKAESREVAIADAGGAFRPFWLRDTMASEITPRAIILKHGIKTYFSINLSLLCILTYFISSFEKTFYCFRKLYGSLQVSLASFFGPSSSIFYY